MAKEYIERERFVHHLENCIYEARNTNCYTEDFETCLKDLKNQPTADVQEVVRCEDCIYYIANYCTRDIKGRTNMFYMSPEDFCSYGAKMDKESEQNDP